MAMSGYISIDVPAGLEHYVDGSPSERDQRIAEAAVVGFYQRGVISSGKAAELLGMERDAFWNLLHDYGIAFIDMDAEEFDAELESSKLMERPPAS